MKKYSNVKPIVNMEKNRIYAFIKLKDMVLLSVLIFISMLLLSCEKDNSVIFPPSLTGTWVTDELKYRDRYIDIDDLVIVLGTGKGTSNTFIINKIKKNIKKPMDEWIFFCENGDSVTCDFVIFHNNCHDSNILYLKHMKGTKWRKVQY